jgi:ribonuclease III
MSKRSFEEFATTEPSNLVYHAVLDHANRLLGAAQSLKQDLERLGKDCHQTSHEKILSTLKRHNAQIFPATQALFQAEVRVNKNHASLSYSIRLLTFQQQTAGLSEPLRTASETSQKVQKVGNGRPGSPNASAEAGLSVPHPEVLTEWTPENIPQTDALPPLPPVLDPVLEKASRTHSGIASTLGEMSYERLEWIGDAYLYLISSLFIYQTFPNLPTGRSSQLRERLIKNETLSEFTMRYGIDKRARLPTEFQAGGRVATGGTSASKKERKKLLGDLFEAYAAAAILGDVDGLARVTAWIKPLWSTILKHEICDEYKARTTAQRPTNGVKRKDSYETGSGAFQPVPQQLHSKAALAQAIGAKTVTISYRDEGAPKKDRNTGLPWFTVGAYYDGLGEKNLLLGHGSGLSKKEAGANAATKALENKKLIKRLRKLKEDMNAILAKSEVT